MSIVSPFHDVEVFTAKSKPLDGQRLSIITFKTPKDQKDNKEYKKPQNRCVSVPCLKLKSDPDVISSAMQALFEELQDSVIRKHVVAAIEDEAKIITVSNDQISFAACAAYAAENAISGKLTKDVIATWFDENMDEKITIALAAAMKLPTENIKQEQLDALNLAVKQHKELFSKCAATVPSIAPKIAKSLLNALKLVEEDRVQMALVSKLKPLANPADQQFFGL